MREILKYGATLMALTGALSFVLAFVYEATEPRRAEIARRDRLRAVSEVLPHAGRFEEKDFYFIGYEPGSDEPCGFAFTVSGEGYSGPIESMVGISPHCGVGKPEITGIKIISQRETPGLGARVEEVPALFTLSDLIAGRRPEKPEREPSPWFQEQFRGKTAGDLEINSIDAVTGATITTEAVIFSVKEGIGRFEKEVLEKK